MRTLGISLALAALGVSAAIGQPMPRSHQDLDHTLYDGVAAYREGKLLDALECMTRALDMDPKNATAKNYIWTITKKLQRADDQLKLAPREKEKALQLASRHLSERRRKTVEILESLKQAYQKSRSLRSPSDLLASRVGLERFLGEAGAERVDAQAETYFKGILANLSAAIERKVFISKKDQYDAEGFLHYYRQEWGQAIESWEWALKEDPRDARIREDLDKVRTLVKKEKEEETLKELVRQAETYSRTGYLKEAMDSWREVLKLNPYYPGAKQKLASSEAALVKSEQTEEIRKKTNIGLQLYQSGKYFEAAQVWLEALQIDPSYKQARDLLRLVGEKLRHLKSAEGSARSSPRKAFVPAAVFADDPAKAEQLYKEGLILYSQEQTEEAIAAWKQALSYAPGMTKIQKAIDRAKADVAY